MCLTRKSAGRWIFGQILAPVIPCFPLRLTCHSTLQRPWLFANPPSWSQTNIYITVMHDCAHEYTRITIYIYIICVCVILFTDWCYPFISMNYLSIFIYWFIYCFIKCFFNTYHICVCIYIYIVLEWVSTWPSCDPWHPKTIVHAANLGRHLQCMVPSVWYITNFHQFHYQHFFILLQKNVTQCD